ncbi:MAG TPA: hypothetical protein VGQ71_00875 [Terriglobales bacterium]|jgi:hypothetical protein|nr:hypothetical protein [Terriglobales bacterium]
MHGKELIESRFGKLGSGLKEILIGDGEYDLDSLLARMDLAVDDTWPIDVQAVESHYCVRYYDGQDQRIVACEFDAQFRFIAEHRGHIAQWIGDEAYFDMFRSTPFKCPLVPGDDF